jgi:NADP-dependent 3-hydroxy acid dehydrogenase YdfG
MYAASKAAVARLTDALRADVGEASGIRVAMIKPGATLTPGFGPGIRDPELRDQIVTAARRNGMEPAAVAAQICHILALPRTASITEMTLVPHLNHPQEEH